MMSEETMILWVGVGVAVFFILLIGYIYLKDSESNKRLGRFEKSIEELNKEVYRLQKKIKEEGAEFERFKTSIKSQIYQDMRQEMKSLLDSSFASQVQPLRNQTQNLQTQWDDFKENIEGKLLGFDERIREFAYTPSNPTNIDEGRIIAMFKDGWSIDSIAKELRIGKGEVEFTLKFANLK